MPLSTILWLALLVVLALLFTVTMRRMSALVARTRSLERLQRSVASIDLRLAACVLPLTKTLDDMRRSPSDPTALREQVARAQTLLADLVVEARTLETPVQLAPAAAVLAGELQRASRAASLVEHGLGALETTSRGRDLEAQTSLKRGALNLRHAQEALARVCRDLARVSPADLAPGSTIATVGAGAIATYPADDSGDPDGRFDPRM